MSVSSVRERLSGRGWRAAAWSVAVAALLAGALIYVDGTDPLHLLPLVQAMAPVGAVLALGLAVAALAVTWRASLVLVVAAVLMFAPTLIDVTASQPREPIPVDQREPGTVTVLAVNTFFGYADPASTLEQVRRLQPDVLVLSEEGAAHWEAMLAGGLQEVLPHATGTVGGSAATVVATREPVTCVELPAHARCGEVVDMGAGSEPVVEGESNRVEQFDMPAVRLADGTLFRGIHLWSPRLDPMRRWCEDQQWLGSWFQSRPEERVVMAGDFNATVSHPVFRRLIEGAVRVPSGYLPWTRTWRIGPLPHLVQIDHVVARGFEPVAAGVVPTDNSDHEAVWAQLRPVS